ncbi:hypothetical protein D3C75_671810 [compost metagenome]
MSYGDAAVFSTSSKRAIFLAEFLYQVSNQQYARYNQAIVSSIDRVVITGMLFPDFINWGIGYDK